MDTGNPNYTLAWDYTPSTAHKFNIGDKVWVRTPRGYHPGVVAAFQNHPFFTDSRYVVRWRLDGRSVCGDGWCDLTLSKRV